MTKDENDNVTNSWSLELPISLSSRKRLARMAKKSKSADIKKIKMNQILFLRRFAWNNGLASAALRGHRPVTMNTGPIA